MYANICILPEILKQILNKNFEDMKRDNSHSNRMYMLGLLHIAQFANDVEIQNIVQKSYKFIDSTAPEVDLNEILYFKTIL